MLQVAPVLTHAGESLQIRALSGEQIIFTRMKIGSGTCSGTGKDLTDLVTPKLTFDLTGIEVASNYATITGQFDTTMISESFQWKEFGLFCAGSKSKTFSGDGTTKTFTLTDKPTAVAIAKVGGSVVTVSAYNKSTGVVTLASAPASGTNNVVISYPDSTEQLYAYSYDASAGMIRAGITSALAEQVVECVVAIGDATEVTAILTDSALYARKTDFDNHANDIDNPHSVTAAQVGLGNVPNVSTNNQTPTYSFGEDETPTLADLVSGETMSAAFKKLHVAVHSHIEHLSDRSNPHHVSYAQVGAAPASHNHSVNDLTGILPVEKGGTGGGTIDSTPTENSTNMVTSGGVYAALQQAASQAHTHTVDDINGVMPTTKGGTGYDSVDTTPTSGSKKMVTSGGVYTALTGKANTSHNHDERYTQTSDLNTLLAGKAASSHSHNVSDVNGTLPVSKGGTGNTSVDTTPTANSTKMVTSGGVYAALQELAGRSHTHTVDQITGILPVTKGGTGYNAVDSTPTANSNKMVTSGGVYSALSGKANSSHNHDSVYTKTTDLTTLLAGKAAASHTHAMSDLTGTLSVAKGGSGKTSLTSGAILKGNGTSGIAELTGTGAVYATTNKSPVFGTLPVSCGGIGQTTLDLAVGTAGARSIYAGTGGMTAGSTALTTGRVYLQYV